MVRFCGFITPRYKEMLFVFISSRPPPSHCTLPPPPPTHTHPSLVLYLFVPLPLLPPVRRGPPIPIRRVHICTLSQPPPLTPCPILPVSKPFTYCSCPQFDVDHPYDVFIYTPFSHAPSPPPCRILPASSTPLSYTHSPQFDVDHPYDVFISWRYAASLMLGKSARQTFLWLHDLVPASALPSASLLNLQVCTPPPPPLPALTIPSSPSPTSHSSLSLPLSSDPAPYCPCLTDRWMRC